MQLYYNKKLKGIVDAKWKLYIAENPSMEKKKGETLKHRNAIIREIFNVETDEVKVAVEKRCEEGGLSNNEDIELDGDGNDAVDANEQLRHIKANDLQRKVFLHFLSGRWQIQPFRAQSRLRCTIEGALEEIQKECGLVGFIIVGGPKPKCGGDVMIMSCVLFTLLMLWQRFSLFLGLTRVQPILVSISDKCTVDGRQISKNRLLHTSTMFSVCLHWSFIY